MSAMVASCSTESRIVIDVALEHRATLATALAAAWSAGEFEAFGLYRGCDDGWYGTAGPALAAETWLRAWTAAQGIKLESPLDALVEGRLYRARTLICLRCGGLATDASTTTMTTDGSSR